MNLFSDDADLCLFCGSGESSPDTGAYGELLKTEKGFAVHNFCMVCTVKSTKSYF